MKKIIGFLALIAIAGLVLPQLVPLGRDHNNPPPVAEPPWSSPAARSLVKEHCFQCHSNETQWPWYSNIAPASWLISADVVEGRSEFNFSEWSSNPGELDEMVEAIQEGEMPPIQYWLFHPGSRLDDQQKTELITALRTSIR